MLNNRHIVLLFIVGIAQMKYLVYFYITLNHWINKNIMNEIRKHLKSLKQAERFQNSLYNKYNYVRLVTSPIFTEDGLYIWNVSI